MIVRPHAITANGIRVRYSSEIDIPIAWEDVHSITRRKHVNNGKQPKVTLDENGETSLHMRIQNETNIEIRDVDDPKGFTDEVRHHI
jgi:hypothetical protein